MLSPSRVLTCSCLPFFTGDRLAVWWAPLPGLSTQTQPLWQQKMLLLAGLFPSCCGWPPCWVRWHGRPVSLCTWSYEEGHRMWSGRRYSCWTWSHRWGRAERLCQPTRKNNNMVIPQHLYGNESRNPHPPMDTKLQEFSIPSYITWCQPSISTGSTSHCTLEVPSMNHK